MAPAEAAAHAWATTEAMARTFGIVKHCAARLRSGKVAVRAVDGLVEEAAAQPAAVVVVREAAGTSTATFHCR